MKNRVYQGQSFLDKVMELTGSIENAFEMALLNGVSITDDLEIDTTLKNTSVTHPLVTQLFNETNRPATACPVVPNDLKDEGINFMEIEEDFIVQ
ncbi:hypothetical protein [Aquimarina algiphila]|uniref:hypothetical protein n=1 Tax=Aquimarina algiphila TaxID=2047982 RepID=UPI00232FB744|nr:hypothetical protein [Aquimarina algiphila]